MRALMCCLVCVVVACSKPSEPARPPAADKPAEPANICGTIAERYGEFRSAVKTTCEKDADCGCHLVLTLEKTLAVADRASAAKLQAMSMAYRKAHCPTTPPASTQPECVARCEAGQCR
ncbi:hypothetical protein LZ198_09880 [Myxococcus sp. K15C18031901]|uniref:hypothetical protein n=1 Tax=Myxococcus dinghuensis TaxID=2906761 RepID=UPI0020A74435|nr:hypothetical protein [Myxococcus dinghuensis]MCP3099177.1 hypothetical protein [Myxococcus dinghuensis]